MILLMSADTPRCSVLPRLPLHSTGKGLGLVLLLSKLLLAALGLSWAYGQCDLNLHLWQHPQVKPRPSSLPAHTTPAHTFSACQCAGHLVQCTTSLHCRLEHRMKLRLGQ